ncbi:MAG TPA: right-handed parallel beta-helix repeat-containing protein [Thermoanaerobaculia bacterium]|nr:right-handed parallel beta-helix repeat-containing protein [Thermoanaerobaculia bacterium]
MKKPFTLLLFVASVASGQVQTADLHWFPIFPSGFPVRAGQLLFVQAVLKNLGPDSAMNVLVTFDTVAALRMTAPSGFTCNGSSTRCSTSSIAAGTQVVFNFNVLPPPVNGTASVVLVAASDTPDPFMPDNTVRTSFNIRTNPDLRIMPAYLQSRLEPSQSFPITIDVSNVGYDTAHNVTVRANLTSGGRFVEAKATPETTCTIDGSSAVCRADMLKSPYGLSIILTARAPDRLTGGRVKFDAVASSDEVDFDPYDNVQHREGRLYRHLIVSNSEDEGFGSFRQALRDVNAFCADDICRVVFELPTTGKVTIRPQSPLPAVTAPYIIIDGRVPNTEIELNGGLLETGDGLQLLTRCDASVLGLTIDGFPGAGIVIGGGASVCRETGDLAAIREVKNNKIASNGRGIVIGMIPVTAFFWRDTVVANNTISDNRFSGIFVSSGGALVIEENSIRNNGRSGIYLGTVNVSDVGENVIDGNAEFGIALQPQAHVSMYGNSIVNNGLTAIDVGLDLVNSNVADDRGRAPNAPVLASANFDPVLRQTIVRGHVDSGPLSSGSFPQWFVTVYGSTSLNARGFAQSERQLSGALVPGGHGDFQIAVNGDLTGQFLSATLTRSSYIGFAKPPDELSHYDYLSETSELSNAVVVER